jgi:hypothetical protein
MTKAKTIIDAMTIRPVRCYADSDVKEWRNTDKKLHREDGPAVEYANGQKEWWIDGQRHREDGPAILHDNGSKSWYLNNERHRLDGPAIEYFNGSSRWFLHNVLHRIDGPAVEIKGKPYQWWINGREFTEDEFNLYVDQTTGEVLIPPGKKLEND